VREHDDDDDDEEKRRQKNEKEIKFAAAEETETHFFRSGDSFRECLETYLKRIINKA
jgi:hypothetical protein